MESQTSDETHEAITPSDLIKPYSFSFDGSNSIHLEALSVAIVGGGGVPNVFL